LDPELFDRPDIAAELSRVARQGRQCEIRILLKKNSAHLSKRSHGLGTLHRRLGSSVRRKPTFMPENLAANYVLADDRGVFFLPMEDDKSGFLNADDRPIGQASRPAFDDMWSRATKIPNSGSCRCSLFLKESTPCTSEPSFF
jgi:hypothetical protein